MTETISPQTHVARGATFIFIQGFVTAILGVVYVWFLLHTEELTGQVLFTDADMGLFTMLSFILTLASTLGVLALRSASVRYIAHYLAEGKRDEAKSVVTRVLQVSAVTSLIVMFLLLLLAGLLSNIFSSSLLIFTLLPLSSFFTVFYTQAQGFLQGLQKMREMAIIALTYTVVHYSVSIVLVYAGFGVLGIVISWVSAFALLCFIALSLTFRHIEFSAQLHDLKPLLTFSFPIYVSTVLTFIVGWVDQIFVFPFLGFGALGVYNLAVRASTVPTLVSTAMVTSLFPKLSELYSTSGIKSLSDAFRSSTRYAALIGFPISLMVATLAYPIIVLFATVRFVDAVLPLAIMCVAALPTILGASIYPTLYTLERTRIASVIMVGSILMEVFFSYISLAYFNAGLGGVAFSRFLAAIARFVFGVYVLRLTLRAELDREAIWKSALASLIMVFSILALEFSRAIVDASNFQFLVLRLRQLPIYAAVGVIVYVSSLIVLKTVKKRDTILLREYLPHRLRWIAHLFERFARVK